MSTYIYKGCIVRKNQWGDTVHVQIGRGGAIHQFNTLQEAFQFVYRLKNAK